MGRHVDTKQLFAPGGTTGHVLTVQSNDTIAPEAAPGGAATGAINGFRLTPRSDEPVPVAARYTSTIYLTPFTSGTIDLYDGSKWVSLTSGEVSLALSSLTSGKNYDVFAYDSSGTLTLELHGWVSNTWRATQLVRQDGIWCKTGALTRRYVGTIRTTGTNTTEDTPEQQFVWNAYNRVFRAYTSGGAGVAPLDPVLGAGFVTMVSSGGVPWQFNFVRGLDEEAVNTIATARVSCAATAIYIMTWTLGTPGGYYSVVSGPVTSPQTLTAGFGTHLLPGIGFRSIYLKHYTATAATAMDATYIPIMSMTTRN